MSRAHEKKGKADRPVEWSKTLANMHDVACAALIRKKIEEPAALATAVITAIADYLGGRLIYLPQGAAAKIAARDREIYARMGKSTALELAAEYGLNHIHIYKIVRQQRELLRKGRRENEADAAGGKP